MTYENALAFVYSRRKYEKSPSFERLQALLSALGNPHSAIKTVHIVGTNGKGTVATQIASCVQAAGYKAGLFTSPYVTDFRERIRVNSKFIEKDNFASIIDRIQKEISVLEQGELSPTFFEVVFAAAMFYFQQSGCDLAVLEAGIGGKTDSTNIISPPLVTVITSVSLDHTDVLGDNLTDIAKQKCAVIKSGSVVVSFPEKTGSFKFVPQQPQVMKVLRQACQEAKCELFIPDMTNVKKRAENEFCFDGTWINLPLIGDHQAANTAVAVTALKQLEKKGFVIPDSCIVSGIQSAFLPARMELLPCTPPVLLDGGHNAGCMQALANVIVTRFKEKNITAVMAFMNDKDYKTAISIIAPMCDKMIFTSTGEKRSAEPEALSNCAANLCKKVYCKNTPQQALTLAKQLTDDNGLILCAGSFYLASDIRNLISDVKHKI